MGEEMHNGIEIKIQNVNSVDCVSCHSDGNQFSTKTMEQYTDAPLFKVLSPIFTGMKLLGLYHHKQYIVTDEHRFEGIKNQHPTSLQKYHSFPHLRFPCNAHFLGKCGQVVYSV